MTFNNIKNIFLIGIGGIGMSALARYFITKKKYVMGYDRKYSEITEALQKSGAIITYDKHDYSFIEKLESQKDETLVIYSSAIKKDHSLLNQFIIKDFNIAKRASVLEIISNSCKCIAIAGTHGKTTTASILTHILSKSDIKFMSFVGGIMKNFKSNFLFRGEDYIIIDADEFDKSFLKLSPDFACITSIDPDHLDIYGNKENLISAFKDFAKQISHNGFLITHENLDFSQNKYGLKSDSDYQIINYKVKEGASLFDIKFKSSYFKDLLLPMIGMHNVLNATAAISIANQLGIKWENIFSSIASFKGVERRLSFKIISEKIVYIDDYAHHPEEIIQTYLSLKDTYPNERILVVFQPHLFSRTKDLIEEFAVALSNFDAVILLEIYPAREQPIEGVNSNLLLSKIDSDFKIISSKSEISKYIKKVGCKINITMGAGDISNEVEKIKEELAYEI